MPDYRTHTLVAERGDVDFHKQPDPLRKNRRKWILLAGCLGLWPLLWQWLANDDQTIYWAHTVSTAHQMVQHDCKKCHREWCQTFRMNFMTPTEVRVVEANTCQACHWEDTRDHTARMVSEQAVGCFDCHAEHRRKSSLNDVADVFCVGCHQNLKIEDSREILRSPNFVAEIHSIEDHPEFLIRSGSDLRIDQGRRGSDHKAFALASPPGADQADDGDHNWHWTDRSHFKFNHAKHLLKEGVGIPADHPHNQEQIKKGFAPKATKQMGCADCHQMDAGGEYFRPIHYETHCAECHRLSYSEELSETKLDVTETEPLPHERAEIIRGTLRDRLTIFIKNHPDRLSQDAEQIGIRLPNKNERKPQSHIQAEAEWVEYQLAKLESIVQGKDEAVAFRQIQRGCLKCHEIESLETDRAVNWEVKPPRIPDRWLPHSRFRHDRHDMLECFDCHFKKPPAESNLASIRSDEGSIFQSRSADDILMPTMDLCRSCHGKPVESPLIPRVRARSECTECHRYHHTLSMTDAIRDKWDRSDGVTDVEKRLWRTRQVPVSRDQLLDDLPRE